MAATNFTPIQLYFSTTASAVPLAANLAQGELAINITDGKLYYEDGSGAVQVIATKGAGTIGGSTTQIQYNNAGALAGSAAMVFNSGTSTTTLTTLNLTNALGAIYGGTAQSTYAQGDVLYASAANTLAKLGIGASTFILTSNGTIPEWVAPSSIAVLTATNLAGGAAGSVPYQSGVATTTFLAIGAASRVMTSSGTAPQWVTSLTGLTGVSSSSITNTSLTAGRVVISSTAGLQSDDADLTFDGTTLSSGGFSTVGLSTLVKTVKIGDSSFNGVAVFAAATPAKLYMGTGTVTDVTSAISATNTTGAIASLGITPIAATNTGVTYTNASTLYIAGAPSAGTNITITNPYALYVAAGATNLGGNTAVTGTLSATGITTLGATTQITGTGVPSGSGLELQHSGAVSTVLSFNRTGSAYLALDLSGLTVNIKSSGSTVGAFSSTGLAVTGTLSATGDVTLGDASTDTVRVNGYISVGGAGNASIGLFVQNAALTGTAQYGVVGQPTGSSAATTQINGVFAGIKTAAASFTVTNAAGFRTEDAVKGAGSTITSLHGLYIADQVQGTNNYGITSLVSSGTNKYNLYISGTADNYFAGNLGIGTSSPAVKLDVSGTARVISYGSPATGSGVEIDYGAAGTGIGRILAYDRGGATSKDMRYDALSHTFKVGASIGTTAVTIDSSGNLGIGTTSPAQKLDVVGNARFTLPSAVGSVVIRNSSTVATEMHVRPEAGKAGWITFTEDAVADRWAFGIAAGEGSLRFISGGISGTERMRLDASGNLLVGTTTNPAGTRSLGFSANAGGNGIDIYQVSNQSDWAINSSSGTIVNFYSDNGTALVIAGSITVNAGATLYNVTSDYRLKDNIQDAAPASSLIDAIQVRQFNWKAGGSHQRYGFIAQELVTVAPEAVYTPTDPDEMMAVDYSKLVPMLVKELQSLRARVTQLESNP